jgi:hypothetical protein
VKASKRAEKMGAKAGLAGALDSMRYHEASRQSLGLLLLPVCAWWAGPGAGRIAAGLAIAALGQLWRIYAAGLIRKNRQLATTGAYSLVRHPLYLGNLAILGGFALACANWLVAIAAGGFLLFYYPPAIRYEDAKLEDIFGQEWRDWSRQVPAMLPGRGRWRGQADAAWSARQSLLRNGELYIGLYVAACGLWLLYRQGMI